MKIRFPAAPLCQFLVFTLNCLTVCFVLSTGCGKPTSQRQASSDPPSVRQLAKEAGNKRSSGDTDGDAISGHHEMLGILSRIRARMSFEHPYIGTAEADELKQLLDLHALTAPIALRWDTTFRLAELHLQLGKEREAIKGFSWCAENADRLSQAPEERTKRKMQMLFELGIAYLRLGETQNCCLRNHPESCILPIKGEGVHTNKEGSQEAIKCFTRVLENTEPKSAPHLMSRWLLNIAWMTLGEHPRSVPSKYLIPVNAYESKEPFVRFVNVAQRLNLDSFSMSGGAIVDDFDNDDYLDLIVSPWDPTGQIKWFRNNRDGTFEDRTKSCELEGFPGGLNMVQADFDNDGDVDFFVLRGAWLEGKGRHPNSLIRNNGDGTFTDVTLDVGMFQHFPTQTASWADYDNDGDLDLYIGNESDDNLDAPCQLYRNDGMRNGRWSFNEVARPAGITNDRYTKAVVWGDYDGDRYPDLYVSNDNAENRLYRNNHDGTFTDIAAKVGVQRPIKSFPSWFWDYDNDGNLDLYVSAYTASTSDLAAFYLGMESSAERSRLYRGDGNGGFVDVASECGLTRPDASMGANFGDLNNDGYLDFYLGTGYPKYESLMPSVMYLNRDGKRFADITTAGGFGHLQKGHAVAFADFDHDGDQDVFEQMGGAYPGDRFNDALYENPGQGNHWITLRLNGTTSNRSAIGARICVEVNEASGTRKIYRHVNSGGSFGANPLRQTIGLGTASRIETVEVYWPTSDTTQTVSNIDMDAHYAITEGQDQVVPIEVKQLRLGNTK